jgi:large subunit ribosomal protein L25
MELGDTLHLSDIPMPKGVTIVALTHGEDHDTGIVTITHPDRGTDEEGESEPSDDAPRTEADNGGEGEQV